MSKEKKIHIIKSVIKHGLLLCVGFFWIYPFLWMISASFKGQNEFFQNRMGLIPVQPTIDNFIRIWQKADFGTYFINTIIVTAFSVIIVLIMTMMAGYAMGRYKFLGRNLCMAVFLASIAIPLVSTIIPTYEVVKGMNLVGTKLGLILSQAGGAHVIFLLLFTSFFQSVPNELEEASKIDGCNYFQTFFYIMMKLCKPVATTVVIISAISEHGYASRCITFASTSGGGNDRFGRSPDSYNSLLGKWNRNIPIWNKMDHDSDIRNMYIAAA